MIHLMQKGLPPLDRGKGINTMPEPFSAKEAARELGTDARTFRKFMRATLAKEDQPGQGNRYQIEPGKIKALKRQFDLWSKPSKKAETNSHEEVDLAETEIIGADEEDIEPSDEDIELIDSEEEFDFEALEEL